MLRNKTAIECWNIEKYETESMIGQIVHLKGKRSRKKQLLKEDIRKIVYKQIELQRHTKPRYGTYRDICVMIQYVLRYITIHNNTQV